MPDGTSPVARIISKVIKHKFGMDEWITNEYNN
jgi:hypothetical protein